MDFSPPLIRRNQYQILNKEKEQRIDLEKEKKNDVLLENKKEIEEVVFVEKNDHVLSISCEVEALEKQQNEISNVTPTPLPKMQIFAVIFVSCCETLCSAVLFPYITFMIRSFHLVDDDTKIGYYAGILGSTYYVAQFICSFFISSLAERFGRRRTILVSLASAALCCIMFGFSTSLYTAIIFRFLSGINGISQIGKTHLGSITDNTNQARAFSFIGLTWGVSGVLAPLIGGLLSEPADKYPSVFGGYSLFVKYPFCLPNLIVGTLTIMGMIVAGLTISDTKKENSPKQQQQDQNDVATPSKLSVVVTEEDKSVEMVVLQCSGELSNSVDSSDSQALVPTTPQSKPSLVEKYREIMGDRVILLCTCSYLLLGINWIMWDEVFPVWTSQKFSVGGLGFKSSHIGIICSCISGLGMLFNIIIYPTLVRKFGLLGIFRITTAIATTAFITIPMTPKITLLFGHESPLSSPPTLLFLWASFQLLVFSGEAQFVSVFVLINNSAYDYQRSTVNGLSQALVSIGRTIGPATSTSILAWSLNSSLSFPFNHMFVFILMAMMSGTLLLLTIWVPPSIQNTKSSMCNEKEKERLSQ